MTAATATPADVAAARSSSEVGVADPARHAGCSASGPAAVHPDLQPASYLMLAYLVEHGPLRARPSPRRFDIDKGAVSRQVQHLVDLGLVEPARRTPPTAGAPPS